MLHIFLALLAMLPGEVCIHLCTIKSVRMDRPRLFFISDIALGYLNWIIGNLLLTGAGGFVTLLSLPAGFALCAFCAGAGRRLRAVLILAAFRVLQTVASAADIALFQAAGLPEDRLIDFHDPLFPAVCLVCSLMICLLVPAAFWLLRRFHRRPLRVNFRFWLAAAPIGQCVLFMGLYLYYYLVDRQLSFLPVFSVCALICLSSNGFYLAAYRRYTRTRALDRELEQARQQLDTQTAYYEHLRENIQQVNQLRHDLNNQLQAASYLLQQGEAEQVDRQLELLKSSIAEHVGPRYCANLMVDAVLSEKAALCQKEHIPLELAVALPEDLPVRGAHLCSIFANLLDNSIHAVRALGQPAGAIRLSASIRQGVLVIHCENPAAPPQKQSSRDPMRRHGLGLVILRQLADTYGGQMETAHENGRFAVDMLLNLAEAAQN